MTNNDIRQYLQISQQRRSLALGVLHTLLHVIFEVDHVTSEV